MAGSATVGSTTYTPPVGALYVDPVSGNNANDGTIGSPKATVAAAVTAATSGDTIVLRAGTYHEAVSIGATKSLTIQSYPSEAVWFDGTSVVTGWTGSGPWTKSSWTTEFDRTTGFAGAGSINASFPLAAYPDGIYMDGVALTQVATTGAVVAGTFCADYAADTLTIGNNPSGVEVRVRTLQQAFLVQSDDSVLRGFGVKRYATSIQQFGTIGVTGDNVTLENLVVDDCASIGVSCTGIAPLVRYCTITNHGMLGVHSNHADGQKFSHCVINDNNTEKFNREPVAGGLKATRAQGCIVDHCEVSGNYGNGIWLDESMYDFQVTYNETRDNRQQGNGIELEISRLGIVAGNISTGNGKGIYVYATGNVDIYNNVVAENVDGSIGMDLMVAQDDRVHPSDGGTPTTGWDDRDKFDPDMSWIVENIVIRNNVFAGAGPRSMWAQDLKNVVGSNPANFGMVITDNWFRLPDGGDTLLVWVTGSTPSYSFKGTVTQLESTNSAFENNIAGAANSVEATAVSAANLLHASAYAMPANVAAALGQATGLQYLGVPPTIGRFIKTAGGFALATMTVVTAI